MKKLLLLLFIGSLTACYTTRNITSSVEPAQIGRLALFEPITEIFLIERGNRAEFNDSLSWESAKMVAALIREAPRMPMIVETRYTENDEIREIIEYELIEYIAELETLAPKKRHTLPVPVTVVEALRLDGHRYGMAVVANGFSRVRGNYTNQVLKGIGITILTGGIYSPQPIKAHSNVACIIVDAETESLVFYNRHFMRDGEPLKADVMSRQLNKIFKKYF
ncbi:MAG: hypothetical protein FWE10_07230 [Rikenellaceae bacterium]|nr:hypothetical protein [Rikenellaceae bacterium]MCL2692372.1 hypothetical protein [Rikenellaceae bacterium]